MLYGHPTSVVLELLLRCSDGELESAKALLAKPLPSLIPSDFAYLGKVTGVDAAEGNQGESMIKFYDDAAQQLLDGTMSEAALENVNYVFLRHFVSECAESPIELTNHVSSISSISFPLLFLF
jgi:hypothetical protein